MRSAEQTIVEHEIPSLRLRNLYIISDPAATAKSLHTGLAFIMIALVRAYVQLLGDNT